MRQINLRLPEELRKKAEKYARRNGYRNIQELAKEAIRMRVNERTIAGSESADKLWNSLDKETREGIKKTPRKEWIKFYKGMKESEKRRLKLLKQAYSSEDVSK